MTTALRREDADERERAIGFRILTLCAAVELLVFSWLLAQGRSAFFAFLWTPDTPGYLKVAERLVPGFTLVASHRTLGYPLVLALSELIGGTNNFYYVVIILQLILNLGFTLGCWRLLQRLAPDTPAGLRAFATVLFFVAGLGMALFLMTDFLGAAFFAVFLYGMLFWRTRAAVLLSASCLALATLTRPAFTLIPVFLPAFAYLIGRVTTRVPPLHVLVFAAFSISATGISVIYQYTYNGYLGPSPILINSYRETVYYGIEKGKGSDSEYAAFTKRFERRIEQRAGRPYATLSPSDKEDYAKAIFREEAADHPGAVVAHVARNFVKYMFVPVESMVMRLTFFYVSEHAFLTYVRPILGLVFLPMWLLSLAPPIHGSQSHKAYYALMLLCVMCLVGLGAITFGSGERIRFSILVFMLPVMIWNAQSLHGFLRTRIDERRTLLSRARLES